MGKTCNECGRPVDMPRSNLCRACVNAHRRAVDAETAQGRVERVRYERLKAVYERTRLAALIEGSAWARQRRTA